MSRNSLTIRPKYANCLAMLLVLGGCGRGRPDDAALGESRQAVVGGQNVSGSSDFPGSMAAIVMQNIDTTTGRNSGNSIVCGGTLINPEFVLTAAHCFTSQIGGALVDFSNYRVVPTNTNYTTGTEYGIRGVFRHPQFRITEGHDIALVRLTSPVTSGTLTKLPTGFPSGMTNGATINIFGWGSTLAPPSASYPATLQKATISYYGQGAACKAFDDAFTDPNDTRTKSLDDIAATELCMGRPSGSTTAKGNCFADSGGPAMFFDGTNNVQVGIVSHGAPRDICGDEVPDVYTSVADNLSFINSVVAGNRADVTGDGTAETTVWLAEGPSNLELFYEFDAGASPLGSGVASSFGPIDTGIPVLYARTQGADYTTAVSIADEDGDTKDDVHVTVGGLEALFRGAILGSTAAFGIQRSAFPSANTNDGRFFALASGGLGTVNRPYITLYVAAPAPLTLPFTVSVFDADIQGYWDKNVAGFKTCMRLFPDKLMNGSDDDTDTSGAPLAALFTESSNETGTDDDKWHSLPSVSPAVGDSAFNGNGWGYRLEIYLAPTTPPAGHADSCELGPTAQSIPDGLINGFKVGVDAGRASLRLSDTELSFMAVDSTGPYTPHTASFIPWKDTDYFGFFTFPFYVGSSTSEGTFINSDADDQDHPSPAQALGKNHEINYRIFAFKQEAHGFYPASEYPTETAVGRPSGGYHPNEGYQNGDQESVTLSLNPFGTGATAAHDPASGAWLWDKINDSNIIHLAIPRGSPSHLEYVAGGGTWSPPTAAMQPLAWRANASLGARLPIALGVPGAQVVSVSTTAQAQALFDASVTRDGSKVSASDRLKGALLTAKLNVKVAREAHENLESAYLYGTMTAVESVIAQGDALIGQGAAASATAIANVIGQLDTINAGRITYVVLPTQNTGDTDPDGDGIIANLDNCPLVANSTQTDTNGNGIGDACEPIPYVHCVAKTATGYTAVFGYTNQHTDRRIAVGVNNAFSPGAVDRGQPSLQRLGGDPYAVSVPFTGSIGWTLAGTTATATSSSTPCSGVDVTHASFAKNVVLYASGDLRVDDRAKVDGVTTVVNAGTGITDIGASASVGDVLSKANVSVRSSATVNGLLRTAGTISPQAGAMLLGGSEQNAALSLPVLAWSPTFPPATGGDIKLEPGAPTRNVAPGSYGALVLKSNTTAILSSGAYYLDSIDLEPGSSLKLNQSAGPVSIYVRTSIIYRSTITAVGGGQTNLVLSYFGSNTAFLETGIIGAIIAPNANLVLGPSSTTYVGTFFAKSIEARPDTRFQFALFG